MGWSDHTSLLDTLSDFVIGPREHNMIAGVEAGPGFWGGGVILVDQHSNRRGAQVDRRTNFIHRVRKDEATASVAFIRVCPTPRLTRNVRRRMARIAAGMHAEGNPTPRREQATLLLSAVAAALCGRIDEARELVARGQVIGDALGALANETYPLVLSWRVETLAGDADAAERAARRGYEVLNQAGALGSSCTFAALLALALNDLGRYAEADEYVEISRSTGGSDVVNEVLWRRAAAKLRAQRGEADDALRLAREGVALMEPTDAIDDHGDALVDLAEVLRLLGRADEGIEPLRRALALYERKENQVSASRVRARLATLTGA
jgi:tetratricopeptide (TPR) repeat protein